METRALSVDLYCALGVCCFCALAQVIQDYCTHLTLSTGKLPKPYNNLQFNQLPILHSSFCNPTKSNQHLRVLLAKTNPVDRGNPRQNEHGRTPNPACSVPVTAGDAALRQALQVKLPSDCSEQQGERNLFKSYGVVLDYPDN